MDASEPMSEDEMVATLAAVSGAEDLEHCRSLLRASGMNLEAAVNVAIGVAPHPDEVRAASDRDGARPDARRPRPRPGPGLVHAGTPPLPGIVALPAAVVKTALGLVAKVVGLGFRIAGGVLGAILPPALARRARALPHAMGGEVDDPEACAEEVAADLRALASDDPRPLPSFRLASHREVLREAQSALKLALVYLHSPDHEDTPEFVRGVLTDPAFVQLATQRFVPWAGDVRKTDAYQLASRLNPSTFPYLALLRQENGRPTLVATVEGAGMSAAELVDVLSNAADAHEAPLREARARRDEAVLARTLREEQDAAFRESLEADARREAANAEAERVAREEAERIAREEAEAEAKREAAEAAERARLATVQKRREEKAAALAARTEPPVDAPGLCKVAVKLPDGSRCERRFLSGDTVGAVFDFVDTLEGAAGAAYSLVSNFPRRVFTRDGDADVTLAEGGLAPQAMLMYQNLDDE